MRARIFHYAVSALCRWAIAFNANDGVALEQLIAPKPPFDFYSFSAPYGSGSAGYSREQAIKFLGDDYPAALQTFYRQLAGFGEVSYNVTDQLKLTAGGRYAKMSFDLSHHGDGFELARPQRGRRSDPHL